MILLVILGYFLIGFIIGVTICKIKGKEWCSANSACGFGVDDFSWKNNAEFIMYISTFFWVLFVLFGPLVLLFRILDYTTKKLQKQR